MRQNDPVPVDPRRKPARGLIRKTLSMENFELTRFEPSDDLKPFIENYWLILWDRAEQPPYTQRNLSHPSQHLVIDPQGKTAIFGMATGVFTYTQKGSGRVLGTKFWPGAFHGFFGGPVSALTDSSAPVESVFSRSGAELDREFETLNDPLTMTERIEDLLRERLPTLDAKAQKARALVEQVAAEPGLVSVKALSEHAGMTVRSLQRLFDTYVGVPPKWVIDRYRMIEAVEALNRGEAVSLTALAHELGYFDQAHFTNAFQALTGHPPSHFREG